MPEKLVRDSGIVYERGERVIRSDFPQVGFNRWQRLAGPSLSPSAWDGMECIPRW